MTITSASGAGVTRGSGAYYGAYITGNNDTLTNAGMPIAANRQTAGGYNAGNDVRGTMVNITNLSTGLLTCGSPCRRRTRRCQPQARGGGTNARPARCFSAPAPSLICFQPELRSLERPR